MTLNSLITAALARSVAGCVGCGYTDADGFVVQLADLSFRPATQGELLAAHKTCAIDANRAEAGRRILAKYPDARQRSAALGVYPTAYVEQMATDIAAVIEAENAAADLINAATTEAEVAAVAVNWPTL